MHRLADDGKGRESVEEGRRERRGEVGEAALAWTSLPTP